MQDSDNGLPGREGELAPAILERLGRTLRFACEAIAEGRTGRLLRRFPSNAQSNRSGTQGRRAGCPEAAASRYAGGREVGA